MFFRRISKERQPIALFEDPRLLAFEQSSSSFQCIYDVASFIPDDWRRKSHCFLSYII